MLKKTFVRGIDWTFGALVRWILRNWILHPLIRWQYQVTIIGAEHATSCTEGAIVVSNHISRIDAPLIMSEAWPFARVRPVAWYAEYAHWLQFPLMKLFGTVAVGSPKHLPKAEKERRKEKALTIMDKILAAGRHILIFCEGAIGDNSKVVIPPTHSGVYEQIARHPEKPVLLVNLDGLEFSRQGKRSKNISFFTRLPVTISLMRFDNVSLEGGVAGLNARLEQFYNKGIPLAVADDQRSTLCALTNSSGHSLQM